VYVHIFFYHRLVL